MTSPRAMPPVLSHARFRVGGQVQSLIHGELIGRHTRCSFCIPDLSVSLHHAEVRLFDGALWLCALGGDLVFGGETHSRIELEVGQRIHIGHEVEVEVETVVVSDRVIELYVDRCALALGADTWGLALAPAPRLVTHAEPAVVLRFEVVGLELQAVHLDGRRQPLWDGLVLIVGDVPVEVRECRAVPPRVAVTRRGQHRMELSSVAAYVRAANAPADEFHELTDNECGLLHGVYTACDGGVLAPWRDVAKEAWPPRSGERDLGEHYWDRVRDVYDTARDRLDKHLAALGLPPLLVLSKGRVGFDRKRWLIRYRS